ncbi:MAG: T9SS type A sorting domain-containing protein [Bacteroidia bacterium]|nr:T9SS type A sorting domain-containing protein [Bacteroidia bacterium]
MTRLLLLLSLIAVTFAPAELLAQARRIVLFEHFTNASCGPCAGQNPAFQDNILAKNKGNMLHIAYHTVWPGRDPMNAHNKEDVAARVSYYTVTGVPDMVMLGGQYRGGPAGVTQDIVNRAASETSPLRIRVRENTNGTTRQVDVDVTTLGQIGTAGLVLRGAVVESDISYATAPGTNGEKDFPNVFRRFINTPAGQSFTPAPIGQTTSLNFEYDLNTEWDASKIFTVVWIQLESTKEVINASAAFMPAVELITEGDIFVKGSAQTPTNFSLLVQNLGDVDQNVKLSFNAEQPADWNASFSVDGTPATADVDVLVPANASVPVGIAVVPGALSGLGEYAVAMHNLDNTELNPQHAITNIISNVTDLLINNDNSWGADDGTNAADFEAAYLGGLRVGGSTTIASTSLSLFQRGWKLGKLDDVKHIYYNVGWAFPALTAELSSAFITHLNTGGNLFIAGQDLGWDTFDAAGHGTSASRAFYRNYLFSNYVSDGTATNTNVTVVGSDPLFGKVPSFRLQNVYGSNTQGVPYFYPDNLRPTPEGVTVAYYGSDPTAGAMIRGAKNDFKTVNLGFGIEQVADATVREELMKLVWQWFHGIISSVEFDGAVASLTLTQNYPNPASEFSLIQLGAAARERRLEIYDIAGRLAQTMTIAPGHTQARIDVSGLRPGMYTYRLMDGGRITGMNIMQVVR